MPTANVWTTEAPNLECPVLWAYYNGKIMAINVDLNGGIRIYDFFDKSAVNTGITVADLLKWYAPITSIKFPTNSSLKFQCIVAKSGKYCLYSVDIDLASKSGSIQLDTEYAFNWVNGWGHLHRAVVLYPLLIVTDDDGYAHYINLDDGTSEDWDTGAGSYVYRPGFSLVHRKDDIYMLAGRHYSGDPAYLWKLYGKSISSLGVTGGGGSPTPNSAPALFYKDTLFMFEWADVIGADNDIVLFDIAFNHLGNIDLAGITGWGSNYANAALPIAKTKNGNYYSIIGISENASSSGNDYRIYFIEHSRTGNVISSTLLYEILNSALADAGFITCSPAYAKAYSLPLVNLRDKKVYLLGYSVPDGNNTGYFIEVDLSDVWDNIAEFNRNMWFISPLKIPTVLTLTVTPL